MHHIETATKMLLPDSYRTHIQHVYEKHRMEHVILIHSLFTKFLKNNSLTRSFAIWTNKLIKLATYSCEISMQHNNFILINSRGGATDGFVL